jgi:D-inositol-3-phosphate glycosyltransferase
MKVYAIEFSGKGAMIHYNYHLLRSLQRYGNDCTLITSDTYEMRDLPHNFRVLEILRLWDPHQSYTRFELWRRIRRLFRGLRFIGNWFHLIRFLQSEKPDILLIGIIRFGFEYYFLRMLKAFGFPLAAVIHDVHTFDHRPGKPLLRETKAHINHYNKIYSLFDALFVHDRINYNEFLTLYKVPTDCVHEIPLPASDVILELEPDRTVDELRQELKIAPGQPVVMFFGTLAKYKGVEQLIKAFPIIHQASNARLVIAGFPAKDVNPDELKALAAELGVADHISWSLQYYPNERIAPLLELANVLIYPYRAITQSGALKLAYMCGKPVVATSVGGLPDVVEEGGTGFVVPPDDPVSLAKATIQIVCDPKLAQQMGQRAKYLSEVRYSWNVVTKKMHEVFENLIQT